MNSLFSGIFQLSFIVCVSVNCEQNKKGKADLIFTIHIKEDNFLGHLSFEIHPSHVL